MRFEPSFELEKCVDEPGFLANFLSTDDKEHFCSVHKAVIPIARLRVLLDQDDVGDTVSFRCPECSKCMTCKKIAKEYCCLTSGSTRTGHYRAKHKNL